MWKYHEAYHVCRWFTESVFFHACSIIFPVSGWIASAVPWVHIQKQKPRLQGGTCSKNQGPKVSKDSIQVLFINPNKFPRIHLGLPSLRCLSQWIHWMKSKMFIFPTSHRDVHHVFGSLPPLWAIPKKKALPKGPPPLAGKCLALVPAHPTDAAHPPSATNAWPNLWIQWPVARGEGTTTGYPQKDHV